MDKKIALITGANKGIGLETAVQLAQQGIKVIATARNAERGQAAIQPLQDQGLDVEFVQLDVNDEEQRQALVDHEANTYGRLDILVNNAGVMREGTVEEGSIEDWHFQMQVNLTAPFLLMRHAMPLLRDGGGSIVNVGSIEGLGSNPRHPAYGAA